MQPELSQNQHLAKSWGETERDISPRNMLPTVRGKFRLNWKTKKEKENWRRIFVVADWRVCTCIKGGRSTFFEALVSRAKEAAAEDNWRNQLLFYWTKTKSLEVSILVERN